LGSSLKCRTLCTPAFSFTDAKKMAGFPVIPLLETLARGAGSHRARQRRPAECPGAVLEHNPSGDGSWEGNGSPGFLQSAQGFSHSQLADSAQHGSKSRWERKKSRLQMKLELHWCSSWRTGLVRRRKQCLGGWASSVSCQFHPFQVLCWPTPKAVTVRWWRAICIARRCARQLVCEPPVSSKLFLRLRTRILAELLYAAQASRNQSEMLV